MFISYSAIKKILKEAGAERINKNAIIKFQIYINEISFKKAKQTVILAKHAKRKTIGISDVNLAIKN